MSLASEWEAEGQRRQARWAAAGLAVRVVGVLAAVGLGIYLMFFLEADDERVLETLRSAGFQHPTLGGTNAFACDEDEISRRFTATNPLGKQVKGTVCCGATSIGKGCTIRW